jgi:hypothetical protein
MTADLDHHQSQRRSVYERFVAVATEHGGNIAVAD